jgi:hypothetical protein
LATGAAILLIALADLQTVVVKTSSRKSSDNFFEKVIFHGDLSLKEPRHGLNLP